MRAQRIPRLENEEADALTNSDFHHFGPKHRIPVKFEDLKFMVLNELFAEGEEYVKELESLRTEARLERERGGARPAKRPKGSKMSARCPW